MGKQKQINTKESFERVVVDTHSTNSSSGFYYTPPIVGTYTINGSHTVTVSANSVIYLRAGDTITWTYGTWANRDKSIPNR
jgi:hypothetical protein